MILYCCRHVDPNESYHPNPLHDSNPDYISGSGTSFSRNVPLRRTVHTVPLSVYQKPATNQQEISPASTPECSHLRCGTSGKSHRRHPSFFGRLAAKFGRKRYSVAEVNVKRYFFTRWLWRRAKKVKERVFCVFLV